LQFPWANCSAIIANRTLPTKHSGNRDYDS